MRAAGLLVLAGCFSGVHNQYDPNALAKPVYQQPDGSLSSNPPDYDAMVKMNTIRVTNAAAIRLCGVALFDDAGNESPNASQFPIAPGGDGEVMLPSGLDYKRDADKPKIDRIRFKLRAYACRDDGGRGALFKEITGIRFWDGDQREFAHPIVH
jgi:hypothetical protein